MINTVNPPKKRAANIKVDKLHIFGGHPFEVLDNEDMKELTESIKEQGILSPLIVRPLENSAEEYEVISGHRRLPLLCPVVGKEKRIMTVANKLNGQATNEELITALYCRLSVEDMKDGKKHTEDESNSISNQKQILLDY